MDHARRVAGTLALLGLGAAAWFSILLARADAGFRKGTPEGLARAVELMPRQTAYLSARALQLEFEGGDQRPLLKEIARINPRASEPRIRLGLDAEVRGDSALAERWLLEAASVDHQYQPRWTLANFYFRQQKTDEFWSWIRSALEVSYGDRRAAFDLCWQASSDATLILSRAIPDQHDVFAAYLRYLEEHHIDKSAPVAVRLSRWRDPADAAAFGRVLDNLVGSGARDVAREIWRNLGYPEPTGAVYNPDFSPPHIGHGFDWRLSANPGVTATFLDTPSLRIAFDGMQPEVAELLSQDPAAGFGKRYLLRWESRTRGFPANTGLVWNGGGDGGSVHAGFVRASDEWTAGQHSLRFGGDRVTLALDYTRPLGEPRAIGWVELRHVSLEEQP